MKGHSIASHVFRDRKLSVPTNQGISDIISMLEEAEFNSLQITLDLLRLYLSLNPGLPLSLGIPQVLSTDTSDLKPFRVPRNVLCNQPSGKQQTSGQLLPPIQTVN